MMKRILSQKPLGRMAGLTLLETMFALAIGALVLIGAIIFYVSTKQSANANKIAGDMNGIVAGYQSYFAGGNPSTGGIAMSVIQAAGFLPDPLNTPFGLQYDAKYTPTATSGTLEIDVSGLKPGDTTCAAVTSLVGSSGGTSIPTGGTLGTTTGNCAYTYTL